MIFCMKTTHNTHDFGQISPATVRQLIPSKWGGWDRREREGKGAYIAQKANRVLIRMHSFWALDGYCFWHSFIRCRCYCLLLTHLLRYDCASTTAIRNAPTVFAICTGHREWHGCRIIFHATATCNTLRVVHALAHSPLARIMICVFIFRPFFAQFGVCVCVGRTRYGFGNYQSSRKCWASRIGHTEIEHHRHEVNTVENSRVFGSGLLVW